MTGLTTVARRCRATTMRGRQCLNPPHGHSSYCHTHGTAANVRALTASVSQVDLAEEGWKKWRAGDRDWQREAWRQYDINGQFRFVANWVGNSVSRCRLYVAEVDESGEAGPETSDPNIAALAGGPLGRGPAKDEALRLLGVNMFVPGEAFIIAEAGSDGGLNQGGDDTDDRWFVVPSRQIKRSGDTVVVRRSQLVGGGDMPYRHGIDLILRVWTPHPGDTDEPDSPARSALPILRAIEAIWKRQFAELESRLAGAGLLVMAQEFDFPRGDDTPAGVEGLVQLLSRAMATSIQDRSSASAVVPLIATAPSEAVDKIKHLTFWSELSSELRPMMESAIKFLAQSLDVPAEILLGMASANHWSAWQIAEDTVRTQIVPVLTRIADALTTGYLRGALEEMGEDPDRFVYAFDHRPLTERPDRSAEALQFHGAGLISDAAAAEMGAIRDDQVPSAEEKLRRLAERLVLASPALLDDPVLRELVGFPAAGSGSPPAGGAEAPSPPAPPQTEPELPVGEGPPERPAPDEEREQQQERETPTSPPGMSAAGTPEGVRTVVAVAKLATVRALQLAGGRLVSHRDRDRWPDTPRHQLHIHAGPVDPARMEKALRGAWDDLPPAVEDVTDPVRLTGVLDRYVRELLSSGVAHDPDRLRDRVVEELAGV